MDRQRRARTLRKGIQLTARRAESVFVALVRVAGGRSCVLLSGLLPRSSAQGFGVGSAGNSSAAQRRAQERRGDPPRS